MVDVELPYEPEARYAVLDACGALSDVPAQRKPAANRPANGSDDFLVIVGGTCLVSNNRSANHWVMLNKLGNRSDGSRDMILSSTPLTSEDVAMVEDLIGVPRGLVFSWASDKDEPSPTEHSWEPIKRWSAMAKHVREPRGAKSTEHLVAQRESDPGYGNLMPRKDRPSVHEHTYDPVLRWAALASDGDVRAPRGFKSEEHLEVLRQSDPSYGTLMPLCERPNLCEYPYRPERRFAALSRLLPAVRGLKDVAHLQTLRKSDPLSGAAVSRGRQWTARGPAAGWLRAELEGASSASAALDSLPYGESEEVVSEEVGGEEGASEEEGVGEESATSSNSTNDSYQASRLHGARLPRIVSNQLLEDMLLDAEDEGEDAALPTPIGQPWVGYGRFGSYGRSSGSSSLDSDEHDDESIRSAALTHERSSRSSSRDYSERCSNETISSFLDEVDSGRFSSLDSTPFASPRSPSQRGEPGPRWAPPRGVFRDAEMAARAKGKAGADAPPAKTFELQKKPRVGFERQVGFDKALSRAGEGVPKAKRELQNPLRKAALRPPPDAA